MYILYKALFVFLLCMHTVVFSMSFERLWKKMLVNRRQTELIESTRFTYEDLAIVERKDESYFETICRVYLQDIINQEVERQKMFGDRFVPIRPLAELKKIELSLVIKKLINDWGQQLNAEFIYFFRKYKNIRGAWDLFIANVVAMEDMYAK